MEIWLGQGLYKLMLTDADDNTIWTVDNVGSGSGGGTTSNAVVSTISGSTNSLKALTAGQYDTVVALGWRTVGDGGGGTFSWNASSTEVDDGGAYIDGNASYGSTGRWVRVMEGILNVKWWGAAGNTSTDDQPYIAKAIAFADNSPIKELQFPTGTYSINSSVTFTVPVVLDYNAKLAWTNFSPAMTVIIADDDNSQHFSCGSSLTYLPVFSAGTVSRPEWFGASTVLATNSIAINQAMTSVTTNGGSVLIKNGVWLCDASIVPLANVTLMGEGYGSIIKMAATFATGGLLGNVTGTETDAAENFECKNLTLLGLTAKTGFGNAVLLRNSSIHDCKIMDFDGPLMLGNSVLGDSENVRISDNIFVDCGSALQPVILINAGNKVIIERNTIANSAGICITVGETDILSNVVIRNNILKGLIGVYGTNCIFTGRLDVTNNIITVDQASGRAVEFLTVSSAASCINISDNAAEILIAATTAVGINIDGIDCLVTVSNNQLKSFTSPADSIGIAETDSASCKYTGNLLVGFEINYSLGTASYETLGTSLTSQFNGDSTSTSRFIMDNRIEEKQGTDVASATAITIGAGNYAHISNSVAINTINTTGWQSGSVIKLYFEDGAILTHSAAATPPYAKILLVSEQDFSVPAGAIVSLVYDVDETAWVEVNRSTAGSSAGLSGTAEILFGVISANQQFTNVTDRTNVLAWECMANRNDPTLYPSIISLNFPEQKCTADAALYVKSTNAPVPSLYRPVTNIQIPCSVINNGTEKAGAINILTTGYITWALGQAGHSTPTDCIEYDEGEFSSSSTKGYTAFTLEYAMWPFPQPQSPAKGATGQSASPMISWMAPTLTTATPALYRLQLSDSATDLVVANGEHGRNVTTTDDFYDISEDAYTNLNPNTTYYWRLRTENSGSTAFGMWSEVYNFKTAA
jgi:hypothetical protein